MSFNAPHTPLQVPKEYENLYNNLELNTEYYDGNQLVKMTKKDIDDTRKIYGMISNIDDNLGKVVNKLKELRIEDETIIIFMTDNGPQQLRYNGNMKGRKGSVYNGGIRVPFFLKVPNKRLVCNFRNNKGQNRFSI